MNTLRYAERTKTITNCIKQNVLAPALSAAECVSLRAENKLLKKTMLNLRKRISLLEVDGREGSVYSTGSFESLQALKDDLYMTMTGETTTSTVSSSDLGRASLKDGHFDEMAGEDIASLQILNRTLSESASVILRSKGSLIDKMYSMDQNVFELKTDEMITGEQRIARALKAENDKLRKDNKDLMDSKFAMEGEAKHLEHVILNVRDEIKETEAKRDALRSELSRMEESMQRSLSMPNALHRPRRGAALAQDIEMSVISRKPETIALPKLDEQARSTSYQAQAEASRSLHNLELSGARIDELEKRELTFRADICKLEDDLANEHALRIRCERLLEAASTESERLHKECNELRMSATIQQDEKENMLGSLQAKEALIAELRGELSKSQVMISETQVAHDKADGVGEEMNESLSDSLSRDSSLGLSKIRLNPSHELSSTHLDIRIHAAKMLHYANRAIEKGRSNRSAASSIASSLGSEFKPDITKELASVVNTVKHLKTMPSFGKPPLPISRPNSGSTDNQQVIICNMENVKNTSPLCICQDSLFSGNGEHIEFYLPKLGMACSCGNHKKEMSTLDGPDPTALSNILRPWQVEFLSTLNLRNGVDLVHACNQRGEELARAMRKWRKENKLPSVKTKSCAIALHIWSTTCKSVVKYVRKERSRGAKVFTRPEFLEFTNNGDGRTVSTLGYGSIIDLNADFLEV